MCGAVPHQFSAYTFPLLEQRLRHRALWKEVAVTDSNNDGQSSGEVEQIILFVDYLCFLNMMLYLFCLLLQV